MSEPKPVWRAGTLVYDRSGLVRVFFWLLLGDFATTLSVTALPMMLPLYLKNLHFSTPQIAWFMGMGNLAAMVMGPVTGMWSDRLRTRWGRRRPFVLLTTPIAAVGMILIPFMHGFWTLNLTVLMVSFANAVGVVNFYLYNDVIPGALMGRFIGAFRCVGFAGALCFQFLLFPWFDTRPALVWLVVGSVSLVFNMTMLLMVREGEYGPPPPAEPFLDKVRLFIREGLGSPFMWMLWLTLGMTALGGPAANYFVLFFEQDVGLDSAQIGRMMGAGTVLALALAYPCGHLVDRIGPRLVWGAAGLGVALAQAAMFCFIRDKATCFILYLVYYGLNMILGAALLPMTFAHLPKQKFGQLVSCQSLVNQGLLFGGNLLVGGVITLFGNNYRLAFLYGGVIYLLAPVFLILLMRCRNPFSGEETSMNLNGRRR